MRSKHFFGLLLVGTAVALAATGCGDEVTRDNDNEGGGGESSSTTATGTATGTSTSTTTVTTATGGPTGDANENFDQAADLGTDNKPVDGELEPVESDEDFYKFEGKAGQALYIYTQAKSGLPDPFDTAYPDLVLTLYNEAKEPIAENDDPTPRTSNDSEIYTVLPADGTYYLRVTECNAWSASGCAPAEDVTEPEYSVGIFELDPALGSITRETSPDNTAEQPDAFEYQKGQTNNSYVISTAYGSFQSSDDLDAYTVNVHAAVGNETTGVKLDANERLVSYFTLLPTTSTGSTASFGIVQLVDVATGAVYAEIDAGQELTDLSPPISSDKDYALVLAANGTNFGPANPFYFVLHNGGSSNPVEKDDVVNSVELTPEALTKAQGTQSFFVEGNLTAAPADLDYFSMIVPAGQVKASIACGAQRSGSGLRTFKVSLHKQDPMTKALTALAKGSGTETVSADLLVQDIAVTAGDTVVLKLEAGSQDALVTGDFYRCGVHFSAE